MSAYLERGVHYVGDSPDGQYVFVGVDHRGLWLPGMVRFVQPGLAAETRRLMERELDTRDPVRPTLTIVPGAAVPSAPPLQRSARATPRLAVG